jgi:molybdopterin molybdotransferase
MDGYAVRTADVTAAGICLPVSQRIPAGTVGVAAAGHGRPHLHRRPDSRRRRRRDHAGALRAWRKWRGHQPRAEMARTSAGPAKTSRRRRNPAVKLRPQEIALAAAAGLPELPVYRRMRVGMFFTGDELVQPGEPLPPGAIYNSNRYACAPCSKAWAAKCVTSAVEDTLDATRDALRRRRPTTIWS